MASMRLEGLAKLQPAGDTATDLFYQASARNKASQCQASLVVKLPIYNESSDVEELLSSPTVAEEVVSAYYSKLLEDTIGVKPQGPVLRLAADEVGVTKSNVRRHTRVVGGALQVAGTAPQPNSPPGLPARQVQLFEVLQPILKHKQSTGIAGRHAATAQGQQQADGNRFEGYVKQYTYPYNKQHQLSKSTLADQQAAAVTAQTTVLQQQWAKMCTADRRTVSEVSPGAAAAVAAAALNGLLQQPVRTATTAAAANVVAQMPAENGHEEDCCPEQLQEQAQDFAVTGKLIQSHHASFAAQMSAHLLGSHQHDLDRWGLTTADVAAVGELLQAPAVTRLSVTLMYYLHTRYLAHSSHLPAQLIQRMTAQAQAGRKTRATKRITQSTAANSAMSFAAGNSAGEAAANRPDMPEKWDVGCDLLLQKKAEGAAKQLAADTAAAAAAAERSAQQQMLLPQGLGKCNRRTVGAEQHTHARCLSRPGSEDLSTGGNLFPPTTSRLSSAGGGMQRQESSSSSKSMESYVSSVVSYKQAVEAAQHQAHLLASASTEELQSCRLSGILQGWDELVKNLTRSPHGSTFALPTLLLALQVLVDEVFTDVLPLWSHSKQGAVTLRQMTAAVPLLLDPQRNYNTLMVLAGSPAAVAVRQLCDAGPAVAADKRRRRLGLSNVVAAAVGPQPSSPSLRRMMYAAGGKGQQQRADGAEAVQLGAELVHAAAAHRMTQLLHRK